MRCWIELSSSALRHNYQLFSKLSNKAQLIPIIKSNAYGHGLKEIFQMLQPEKPAWLGVNYLDEAASLRELGFKGRILVVGPVAHGRYGELSSVGADLFVGDDPSLKAWLALSEEQRPLAHIKFDTGMGRQGFHVHHAERLAKTLKPYKSKIVAICSHFANVEDVVNHQYADLQTERFSAVRKAFQLEDYDVLAHIASSASTLIMKEAALDFTRVGISLYGLWPSPATKISFLQIFDHMVELAPVLSWKTTIALTKDIKEGSYIGYGCTYRAVKDMVIAVLPVGYNEGYPRIASGRGSYVLIKGKRCPILGRICMNMMMVDISHVGDVKDEGELVTLIGRDGNESVASEDLAGWSETIHYEVLTCLNPQIPRKILD